MASSAQYSEVPEGKGGIFATLSLMASLIREHDPSVAVFTQHFLDQLAEIDPDLSHAEIAQTIFEWVRSHMLYVDDEHADLMLGPDVQIVDKVQHPDVILHEIERNGNALGDCDDYATFLGAIYLDAGYGVTLINVVSVDETEHVYLRVTTPDGVFAADGIVDEPFGWELPDEDRLEEFAIPV